MNSLLNQLNVLNVHIINTDSIAFPIRFQNYFDKILLDAPCTGSGTLLTNPELKWRQNEKFLHQNVVLQKKLLQSALKILKPGGILVYSTCSLYPHEGEYQILDILNSLEPLDLPKWFYPSYKIDGNTIQGTGRLFPSVHHTQGFFIGKFKKKN
jgi:16S rRNA (cytosine967-C5)-methyltransferase